MTTAKTVPHAWECSTHPPLVLICPYCGTTVRKEDPEIAATIFAPCPGPSRPNRASQ